MVKPPHVFNAFSTIPLPIVGYFRCIGISGKFQLVGRLKVRLLKSKWLSRSQQALCGFAALREAKKESRKDAKTQREVE
jgi:hypothetical protein